MVKAKVEETVCNAGKKKDLFKKVGLYILRNGTFIFTVLMLAVPATIAGCKEIVLCSPKKKEN
jgi:histidinol dehydrogenase